jgi:hypothetical protein
MTHLTSDELIDAIEGLLDTARQQHLDSCEVCRQQVADLGSVVNEARAVAVPEPSPLFWAHLSQRVRTAIDAEPLPAGGWREWMRWPVLAPIAALSLVVMALAVTVPRQQPAAPMPLATSAVPADVMPQDEGFAVVADLVGDMDWETAVSAGLTVAPGAADRAVLELTAAEQRELTRLLQAELTRTKS